MTWLNVLLGTLTRSTERSLPSDRAPVARVSRARQAGPLLRAALAAAALGVVGCGPAGHSPEKTESQPLNAPLDPLAGIKNQPRSSTPLTPALRAAMISTKQAEADEKYNA